MEKHQHENEHKGKIWQMSALCKHMEISLLCRNPLTKCKVQNAKANDFTSKLFYISTNCFMSFPEVSVEYLRYLYTTSIINLSSPNHYIDHSL